MFYGGRLASHLCGSDIDDIDEEVKDFISLRRLNRRGVILIDSDRKTKASAINETKQRLIEEFDRGPGYAWVTEGREIENYLPAEHVEAAIKATIPSAIPHSRFGKFENTLSIKRQNGKPAQASKTEVAKYITKGFPANLEQYDLGKQLEKLVGFISESNPGVHVSATTSLD